MATLNRWEAAAITVPTGGWEAELVEAAPISGGGTVAIEAGDYTWATFVAAFKTALDAVGGATYTVSISDGAGGTGQLSVTESPPNDFDLTWTNTDFRDLCGCTGNYSAVQVIVSPNHVKGMWLPDCAHLCAVSFGDEIDRSDRSTLGTPDATNYSYLAYNRIRVLPEPTYSQITRARCRIAGESVTGESFAQFWRDVIDGDLSYLRTGKVRIFPDADTDATYYDYWVGDGFSENRPANVREGWQGRWSITIPLLVRVEI